MADVTVAHPMAIGDGTDNLAMALKVFSGETLAAFKQASVTTGMVVLRTIANGKSAQFPAFGRAKARYLKPGQNLDDSRTNIKQGERVIQIDGLLTSDFMITDIESFIVHYEFRSVYAMETGNVLALEHDASVLAEAAKVALETTENVAGGDGVEGTGLGGVVYGGALPNYGINSDTGLQIYQMLLSIRSKMTKNNIPKANRAVYVDPDDFSALSACLPLLNRDYGARGSIGDNQDSMRLAGFDIYECPHLKRGGSDATNVLQGDGHVFPAAYANKHLFIAIHQTAVGVVRLKDIQTEEARRIEYQANHFVAKMSEGIKGLRPESAFIGVIDEDAPAA